MNLIHRVKTVVQGRVQGIGYRWFVQNCAAKYSVNGWVRNRTDGSIELEAEGPKDTLQLFLREIRSQHPSAQVIALTANWEEVLSPTYKGFTIRL